MSIEAMKQALEALTYIHAETSQEEDIVIDAAITALSAAIEQAEKPVAWMYDFMSDNEVIRDWMTQDYADITRENGFNVRPLYTAPRQWIGLTEDEMNALVSRFARYELARAIEAKLKEKNT